jgi:hypothetical protein
MLNTVTQLLVQENLAMKPEDITVWNIQCGHWVTMHCTIYGRASVLVKVATGKSGALAREAKALREMGPVIRQHLPQLMAFEEREAMDILVQQHLDIQPLVLEPSGLPMRHKWATVVAAMARQVQTETVTRRADILTGLRLDFPSLDALIEPGTDRINLADLPSIAQHGDFTANNLGFQHGDVPVVYDWEDYGLVDLPGFDIALLLGSLATFDAPQLQAMFLQSSSLHHEDALELVRASGMKWNVFHRLLPAYYAVFYGLKGRGTYNPKLQAQCKTLVEGLVQAHH